MKDKKILVIDDDQEIGILIQKYLAGFGFEVLTETSPSNGLKTVESENPDLLILDIMMPEMDGFELCQKIRKNSNIPVIILTARGDTMDKVVGLEIGADDYLAKPFEPRELLARINSILRRFNRKDEVKESETLEYGMFKIDLRTRQVYKNGEELILTSAQYELLVLLMREHNQVLNRDYLMENIRGIEWDSLNRSVDVLVSRLRKKIGDDPKNPYLIKTIWGTGYLFTGYAPEE